MEMEGAHGTALLSQSPHGCLVGVRTQGGRRQGSRKNDMQPAHACSREVRAAERRRPRTENPVERGCLPLLRPAEAGRFAENLSDIL